MPIDTIGARLKVKITDSSGTSKEESFSYAFADFQPFAEKISIGNLADGVTTVEIYISSLTTSTPMDTEMKKVSAWVTTI